MNDRFESLRQQHYEMNARAPWNQGEQPPPCVECGHDEQDHPPDAYQPFEAGVCCGSLTCTCTCYHDGHEDEPPERDYYEGRY